MKKLRIYLDTSVVNYLYADDTPEKRDATWAFFDRAERQDISLYFSQIVIDEISRTSDLQRRKMLLEAIVERRLHMLVAEPKDEIETLTQSYIERGAIPAREIDDALHVAVCTVNEIDVLASWNFRHLANVRRERQIMAVNESCGYVYPLRIVSPEEAIGDEEED